MKVLVTGSSGHLGEGLVRTLTDAGDTVVGLDVKPSAFTNVVASIADVGQLSACMDGVDVVFHAATLHKPHVGTHSMQAFVDVNVSGTLALLRAAADAGVKAFVFTSTTSTFGDALRPPPGSPATWVTESVAPIPRNIYGVTKVAAEELCLLFHRTQGLNCVILRTSRFFPEADDDPARRRNYSDANVKANEFLFRRADLHDVVTAHLLAAERAPALGFGRFVVSATTPFREEDLAELGVDAPRVLQRRVPGAADVYRRLGFRMFPTIDRVYDNTAARRELDWRPRYDFEHVLESLRAGSDPRSPLARLVGSKGYHDQNFESGPYPLR